MTKKCEVCGGTSVSMVLDLGEHPLCDDLVPVNDPRQCIEYPIRVLFCEQCKTALQEVEVKKRELFSPSYHYRSRFTADVLKGMGNLVTEIENIVGDLAGKTVLDIGCNDGSLLNIFSDRKCVTVGVEPTGAINDADKSKHKLYNNFFDESLAEQIKTDCAEPDIITFTNVFAHIENLPALLSALKKLMGDDTLLVIENHYLGSVLEKNQFDTFYHEHPRTYSLSSFVEIAENLDCQIVDVAFPKRYGGNIRVSLSKRETSQDKQELNKLIEAVMAEEANSKEKFAEMKTFIDAWKTSKKQEICDLVDEYGPLAAKAFPGRAAILIKLLDLNENHISAVYEKPGSMKIGNYVPGTRIPILSDEALFEQAPKVILNLAWHIKDEISAYIKKSALDSKIIDIL